MATVPSGIPAKPRRAQRVRRAILLVGLSVIGLLALTLALLPYVVSLGPVKGQIATHIESALQRKVDIGEVRLQLLGGLGVRLKDLTIYNPPGWPQAQLLKVEALSAKAAWWPLLQRRIEVTKVRLRGGEIVIQRDAQGRLNIDDLLQAKPVTQMAPPSQPPSAPPSHRTQPARPPFADLQVSEISLQDVTIAFVDRTVAPGQSLTTTVSDLQLDVRDIALGNPIPFDLAATVFTDRQRNIRACGHVGPFPASLSGENLPVAMYLVMTDILLHQFASYLGMGFPLRQGRVHADVNMRGHVGGDLAIQGTLTLAEAVLRDTAGGNSPTLLPALSTRYDMALDLANGRLQLTKTEVELSAIRATLSGTVHRLMSTPQLDLHLSTNSFALGKLLTDFPMLASAFPAPTDLRGRAQLQATLKGTPQAMRAEGQVDLPEAALNSGTFNGGRPEGGGMRLAADNTRAMLTLRAEPRRTPHLRMDARAQRVIFDRQTAKGPGPDSPEAPTPKPTGEPPPTNKPTGEPPPTKQRQLPVTLNGQIDIAEGQIQGVHFQQMTADVALIDKTLTSTQQVKVYAGSYQGDVRVDLAPKEPHYTVNAKLLNLHIGQALNELTSVKDALFGVLNSDLQLSGQGLTWDLINQTLTGEGALTISEVQLTTFDLIPKLVQVLKGVGTLVGMNIPADWERDAFDAVEGHVRLQQGKIWTDALKLRGRGLEALLKGYVGLDRSIDYAGTLSLPSTVVSDRGPLKLLRRDDKGRIILPFTVRGTVNSPQIVFDERHVRDMARDALIDTLKKQRGGTADEAPPQPSIGTHQEPQSEPTGQEAGTPQTLHDLPRKILQDLLRR